MGGEEGQQARTPPVFGRDLFTPLPGEKPREKISEDFFLTGKEFPFPVEFKFYDLN